MWRSSWAARSEEGSGHDHRSAVDRVLLHCTQSLVGLSERKSRHLRMQTDFARDLQEIKCVGASHIGHTADLTLSPQEGVIVELWDAVEVNGIDCDHATLAQARQCRNHDITARRKRNSSIQFHWRLLGLVADPLCSQRRR